jgi:hypothetical protein
MIIINHHQIVDEISNDFQKTPAETRFPTPRQEMRRNGRERGSMRVGICLKLDLSTFGPKRLTFSKCLAASHRQTSPTRILQVDSPNGTKRLVRFVFLNTQVYNLSILFWSSTMAVVCPDGAERADEISDEK